MERELEGSRNVRITRIAEEAEDGIKQIFADLALLQIGKMQYLPTAACVSAIRPHAGGAGEEIRIRNGCSCAEAGC